MLEPRPQAIDAQDRPAQLAGEDVAA